MVTIFKKKTFLLPIYFLQIFDSACAFLPIDCCKIENILILSMWMILKFLIFWTSQKLSCNDRFYVTFWMYLDHVDLKQKTNKQK